MIIVYCLDANYIRYAEVSIQTVKKHNPDAKIVVVSEHPMSVKGADKYFIKELHRKPRHKKGSDRISDAAYLKLLLPDILPYDKVIFLDGDTICQKPLDDLWNMEPPYIALCESHIYGKQQAEELGLKKYGLSGMMLMNLKALKEFGLAQKCLEVEKTIAEPKTGYCHEETCINIALKEKLTFVPVCFNYCHNRQYDNPIPEEDAYILHIVGKSKVYMFQYLDGNINQETKYDRIKVVNQYIHGKSVAIVGNAKSIFDKKNGKEIDNHDTIIRFNRGYIYQPECQGSKTTIFFLACNLTRAELMGYNAKLWINRSNHYYNPTGLTVENKDRKVLATRLGAQPSTGFMAIDICLRFGAGKIDLYGFDWEKTPTFYNPVNYVTQHNYSKEEQIISEYCSKGLLTIC